MHEFFLGRVLMVGLGGFLGASARYMAGDLADRLFPDSSFPIATFAVNIVGCLAIGILAGLLPSDDPRRLFVVAGLLGGFTTFSAFAFESLTLLDDKQLAAAAFNVVGQVALGLVAVWLGLRVAQAL